MHRLTVVIPTYNRKALVKRALLSVLIQSPPFSFQVMIADDASKDGTLDSLRQEFKKEIEEGTLLLHSCKRSGDPASSRNQGVLASPPTEWLAFLDSDDHWKPTRLKDLASEMERRDAIFETLDPLPQENDLLLSFIKRNPAVASGTLMKRSVFDAIHGFSEGYYPRDDGPALKLGWEDYETWLKILLYLNSKNSLSRALLRKGDDVFIEPQPLGVGRVDLKTQMRRELGTLTRLLPKIPLRLAKPFARRILGAAKASLIG